LKKIFVESLSFGGEEEFVNKKAKGDWREAKGEKLSNCVLPLAGGLSPPASTNINFAQQMRQANFTWLEIAARQMLPTVSVGSIMR
jgi:hypothetical protein